MITLTLRESFVVFEDNLSDIRLALLENAQHQIAINSPYLEPHEDDEMTVDNIMLHLNFMRIERDAKPLLETVKRIDSYRLHKDTPHSAGFITDDDIARAKEVGPEWFIYEASLSTRKPHKGLCNFHGDRDPSLTLMKSKNTNNFYLKCFSCGVHFDSIGYIMARDNLSFMESVKVVLGK